MGYLKYSLKAFCCAALLILGFGASAYADGTQAGTTVQISFSMDYKVAGVDQPTVDTGVSGTNTPVEFTVDRRIDLIVSSLGNVSVVPGAQDQELLFRLVNEGNDTQAYALSIVNEGGDDFSSDNRTLFYYIDDGDNAFEPDADDGAAIAYNGTETPDLAMDRVLFIVVQADIPSSAGDAEEDEISVVAETLEPSTSGTAGDVVTADGDGNTQLGAAENVLADGSGTANEVANAGDHSASASFTVNDPLIVLNTDDSGAGSLRAAITHANAYADADDISFTISGLGVHVITPLTELPYITDDSVSIDGTTQSGAACGDLWAGTPHTLKIQLDGNGASFPLLSVQGDNVSVKGLSLTNAGIGSLSPAFTVYPGTADTSLTCSYAGLAPDGTPGPNQRGVGTTGVNSVIGGDLSGDGNVISSNLDAGLYIAIASTGAIVKGNFIGTDPFGTAPRSNIAGGISTVAFPGSMTINEISGNLISGNGGHGIFFNEDNPITGSSGDVKISGNYIGVDRLGNTALANGGDGIHFENGSVSGVTIGGATEDDRNVISGNDGDGIDLNDVLGISIAGNYIGLGQDGSTVAANDGDGIQIIGTSLAAIYANSIYGNGGLGIDLNGDGVTANDSPDNDTGPNNLLNFPVINEFATDGATAIQFDLDLNIPANVQGYRIEFFKNSTADPTGYGEGEIYLGFADTGNYAGGAQNITGAFTSSAVVSVGEHISATTTRKSGVSSYDITSEFSLSADSESSIELTASKSVDVYDPSSAGLYMLPGNDALSSLTVTNPGAAAADSDSIVLIDALSAELEFYNGDIDDGGPETNAVSFVQTGGAGLTFNYAIDVKYSNSGIRPATMAGCSYSPSAGYDANVTFVCFNPKGAMAAGDPDPTFTVSYRARIK